MPEPVAEQMTDREREAFQKALPRSPDHEGGGLSIVRGYTEAGYFEEANCVTITDGERTAVYVPYKIVKG